MIKLLKQLKFNFLRKRMKVGASYNLFDGEELIEASIKSIRENVHYINVVYQNVSNFGNLTNSDLKEKLENLKNSGLIDEIYHYEPNLELSPHENEKIKRDIGLKLARQNGCNYFIGMDVDEFYDKEQFEKALDSIIRSNIKTSAVSIVEYLKTPENQLIGDFTFKPKENELYNFYVPFVIKINLFKKQRHGFGYFPCYTDPTRKLTSGGRFKLFSMQEIVMHHMATVRKDLNKKYSNSNLMDASQELQEQVKRTQEEVLDFDFEKNKTLPKDCSIFRKNLVRKVENKFDIELD